MDVKRKKNLALLLSAILCVTGFSGCVPAGGDSQSDTQSSVEEKHEMVLCKKVAGKELSAGETMEITVNTSVGDFNYLTVKLDGDIPVVGYIYYTDLADTTKTHKEKFFIEAGEKEFSMFLDAFRIGAFGAFEKRIDKITLQNVSDGKGSLRVDEVMISDRTYDNTEMLFLDNGSIKVGAYLAAGGALCHLESLDRKVVEYLDENGNVRIDENINADDVNVISEKVSFINIYDLGREIQQSYYGGVGEENGYKPDDDVLYDGIGDGYLYNPVQAGSAGDNQTQIIDYHLLENELYVKSRPQDWFFDNTQTESYMESTYTFDEGGSLIVTNRFVNFAQFTDMDKVYVHGHEIPAVYTVQPLNHFYCETVDGVINDPNLSPLPEATSSMRTSVLQEVEGNYWYQLQSKNVIGSWLANVNDVGFGMGMYIPNVERFSASRGWKTTSYKLLYNHHYDVNIHDLRDLRLIPSAYVDNYNYFSPGVTRRMVDFVPFEYSFALYVGTVDEMREKFGKLKEDGTIKNEGLDNWAKE
ncbi:MAG: hypothetical protein IKA57_01060 [Clostridia bacterium]|nr:hypothetical protein [Clostridia bacterium]